MMDLRKLKTLIDLVRESGITEIEVTEGEDRVRIVNEPKDKPVAVTYATTTAAPPPIAVASAPAPVAAVAAATPAPAPEPAPAPKVGTPFVSPMVGTFYRSSSPGADPFVKVGDTVKKGQVLCIIEAMKLLNEVESDMDGVVKEVCVENGEPVEFGQTLFVLG